MCTLPAVVFITGAESASEHHSISTPASGCSCATDTLVLSVCVGCRCHTDVGVLMTLGLVLHDVWVMVVLVSRSNWWCFVVVLVSWSCCCCGEICDGVVVVVVVLW